MNVQENPSSAEAPSFAVPANEEGAVVEEATPFAPSFADDHAMDGSTAVVPPEDGSADVAHPDDALAGIERRLAELADLFNAKIAHSEYELEVARRYSAELQEHKSDLFRKMTEPILRSVVNTLTGMERACAAAKEKGEQAVALDTFAFYCEDLADLLSDYGIESFEPNVGDAFSSGAHKIVGEGVPVADKERARTIAEVRSKGYRCGENVLLPAKVKVFVHAAPEEERSGEPVETPVEY